jgi:hypothetical protein
MGTVDPSPTRSVKLRLLTVIAMVLPYKALVLYYYKIWSLTKKKEGKRLWKMFRLKRDVNKK